MMVISERLRTNREKKDLSQGDIEERTGLKRCYVSDKSEEWGNSGEPAKFFQSLRELSRLSPKDRKLIMHMTSQLVRKNRA